MNPEIQRVGWNSFMLKPPATAGWTWNLPIYVSVLADQLYVVNFWICLEPCILYSPSLSVQDHFNFPGELRFLNSAPRFQVEEQECKHKRSLFFISRQIWCNSRVKVDGIVRLNVQGWIEIFFPPVQFAH